MTGSASDFVDETDTPVSGALAITSGDFDRNGAAGGDLSATVTGNFDGTDFIVQPSTLSGDFYGEAEGLMLEGTASGFVGDAPTSYDITIVAEATP